MKNLKLCAFADEADSQIENQIKALNDNGIEYIEARNINSNNISSLTYEQAKEYKKIYSDNGIKVWSIGSPIGKINIDDDFDAELDKFKRTVEIGNIMNATCIRMFSFYGTNGKPEYKDRVFERLDKYVCAVKGSSLCLCHENEKGIYGELALQCLEIVNAFPDIKCVFDPANFIQAKQNVPEAWELLKQHVFYCHIKDCDENGNVVPAGYGIAGFDKIISEFSANGGGILSVEPHLAVFAGLDKLAQEDERKHMGVFRFTSNREAFDFAVSSIKSIIEKV